MGILDKYVLDDDGKPLFVEDVFLWADWFEKHDRHVGQTPIGPYIVSTVFLGLDHSFSLTTKGRSAQPVLWETLVFIEGATKNDTEAAEMFEQRRYTSLEEAQRGHEEMVLEVRAAWESVESRNKMSSHKPADES